MLTDWGCHFIWCVCVCARWEISEKKMLYGEVYAINSISQIYEKIKKKKK